LDPVGWFPRQQPAGKAAGSRGDWDGVRHATEVQVRTSEVICVVLRFDETPTSMNPRRKQVLIRETRDLVFRVCSGGGAFLGLVYALRHWSTQPG
jgi:hypothetical protein